MQNLIEIADFAVVTVSSLLFALLLQWLALEGVFRLLQSPAQDRAARPFTGGGEKPRPTV